MPHPQADALETLLLDLPRDEFTPDQLSTAAHTGWQAYVDSVAMVRWRSLNRRIREYPDEPPLMPTLIGNLFRRLDEDLRDHRSGKRLDGDAYLFMETRNVPDRLILHYRTAKNRLDMHSTMVFGFSCLAVFSLGLFFNPGLDRRAATAVTVIYVLLTWVSLAAALRMTRHFVAIARAVGRLL